MDELNDSAGLDAAVRLVAGNSGLLRLTELVGTVEVLDGDGIVWSDTLVFG